MAEAHEVELFFHCAEHCRVEPIAGGFLISQRRRAGEARPAAETATSDGATSGSLAPPLGWVSREFDRRQPTHTIVWRARLSGNALLRTELTVLSLTPSEEVC